MPNNYVSSLLKLGYHMNSNCNIEHECIIGKTTYHDGACVAEEM